MALTMSPMTAAAMGAVPVDKAGVGSGVLNSFRQVGGAMGIAVMGAIVASYVSAPRALARTAQQFVNGLHAALLVSAGLAFAGAAVAIAVVRTHAADGARAARGSGRVTATGTRLPAAERRLAIIQTALRVFTEGSYRGTTTAEIARAAGVSEPILYRHFASKRDLYLAALDYVWARRAPHGRRRSPTPRTCGRRSRRSGAATTPCATASSSSPSCGCRR